MIHEQLIGVLPAEFNSSIVNKIKHFKWRMDRTYDLRIESPEESGLTKGWSIYAYKDNISDEEQFLVFNIGSLVFDTIFNKTKNKYKNLSLERIIINYYNRSCFCPMHKDGNGIASDGRKEGSCLYFLNTSENSYTQICDEKYYSNSGDCVIFDSQDIHCASGAVDSKDRYTMNFMFRYSERTNG